MPGFPPALCRKPLPRCRQRPFKARGARLSAFSRRTGNSSKNSIRTGSRRFSIAIGGICWRCLAVSTADQHIATIKRFLAQALSADAPLQDLSALAVERFLAAEGRRMRRQSLQHVVARLRAFLRFCFEQVAVPERLDTIDAPRLYRGELPPRALTWPLVQRLLRSIDRRSRLGWRDYAILHLMAHYGLRPSEIVTLTLGSIDWQAKTLRVKQCKTRSDLVLPLAGQTMRMLRRYLYRGRPGGARPELFLRARTPAGPLTHCAIGDLYQKRARESGLPLQGTSSY